MSIKKTTLNPNESFCEQAWLAVEDIYQGILSHPFIQELSDGTLDPDIFSFYLSQDMLYLKDFGGLMATLSNKIDSMHMRLSLVKFASNCFTVELGMYQSYIDRFKIKPSEHKSPACFMYTNFLSSEVLGNSAAYGMAAILPCFTVYQKVGNHIYNQSKSNIDSNQYKVWIETYSGEGFEKDVLEAKNIMDYLSKTVTDKQPLIELYKKSAQLEYMFWDSAYKKEQWPI